MSAVAYRVGIARGDIVLDVAQDGQVDEEEYGHRGAKGDRKHHDGEHLSVRRVGPHFGALVPDAVVLLVRRHLRDEQLRQGEQQAQRPNGRNHEAFVRVQPIQ